MKVRRVGQPALYFLFKESMCGGVILAQSSTAAKVAALVKTAVETLGVELWDVKFVKEGASWYLRVFIDKEGGVDINDCTDVSHAIDPILDEADPIKVSYYLEVCSPGLERELSEPWHFERYIGSSVKVKLIRPRDNKKEFIGNLLSFNSDVKIEGEGEELTFLKNEISSVRLNDADF